MARHADWSDDSLSVVYLLHNPATDNYIISTNELIPDRELVESFVVDSRRVDFDNMRRCIRACKTKHAVVELFVRRCQNFSYSRYPFCFGVNSYLSMLDSQNKLPSFDRLMNWKHVNFPPRLFIEKFPHERNIHTIKHIETMLSEWIKYRILSGKESLDSVPKELFNSLNNSAITTNEHMFVECFYYVMRTHDHIVPNAINIMFNITREYVNKNNLNSCDLNDLTPLQLFDILFPPRENPTNSVLFSFRKLLIPSLIDG